MLGSFFVKLYKNDDKMKKHSIILIIFNTNI